MVQPLAENKKATLWSEINVALRFLVFGLFFQGLCFDKKGLCVLIFGFFLYYFFKYFNHFVLLNRSVLVLVIHLEEQNKKYVLAHE